MGCLSVSVIVLLASVGIVFYLDTTAQVPSHISSDIKLITHHPIIERELSKYKEAIGDEYGAYKNHLYRTLTFTMHFLGEQPEYHKKLDVIAYALVYHDIGLWTDDNLAYLEPSIDLARKNTLDVLSPNDQFLQTEIIYWHHKITAYVPPLAVHGYHNPKDLQIFADIVNAVRKADWIDATCGLVTHGMPRKHIDYVRGSIANEGFHNTLVELLLNLEGWNLPKAFWKFSSILKL